MRFRTLLSAGAVVAAGMLVGRVLGLLREVALASHFGTGNYSDVAVFLLILPDLIISVLIANAGSAALIPAFASRNAAQSVALLWQTMLISTVVCTLIAVVGCMQVDRVVSLFALDAAVLSDAHTAMMLMFASLPPMAMTWVWTAWLHYRGRLIAPACANALFNGVILVTLMIAGAHLLLLAVGSCVATVLRLLMHGVAYRNTRPSAYRLGSTSGWELDRKFVRSYLHTLVTSMCVMVPIYMPYGVMTASDGQLALFNYAFKLVLLPILMLQTLAQTVLLPFFARAYHEGDTQSYRISVYVGYVISLSVVLATLIGGRAIVSLCFGHGVISESDLVAITELLKIGVWATPCAVLSCLFQQVCYAGCNTRSAMRASMISTVLTLPLYGVGFKVGGLEGLMLAYVCVCCVYWAPMAWISARYMPSLRRAPCMRTVVATLMMLAAAYLCAWLYDRWCVLLPSVVQCVIAMGIGLTLVCIGLWPGRALIYRVVRSHKTSGCAAV